MGGGLILDEHSQSGICFLLIRASNFKYRFLLLLRRTSGSSLLAIGFLVVAIDCFALVSAFTNTHSNI
jgi:hypothetical protein